MSGIENNETITIPQKEIQKDGATEMLNELLQGFENLDSKRAQENEIKKYVKKNYPEDHDDFQYIVENNATKIADFKKQFKKEVLSNPDFSDGDIPEELQKKMELEDKLGLLMTMNEKQFSREIRKLNEGDLQDLLMINQIINGDMPGRMKHKRILNRMEDIENLYYKKTGIDSNESSKNGNEIMYIYGKNGEKTPVDEFFTKKESTKVNSDLGINEENIATDENGNYILPENM